MYNNSRGQINMSVIIFLRYQNSLIVFKYIQNQTSICKKYE